MCVFFHAVGVKGGCFWVASRDEISMMKSSTTGVQRTEKKTSVLRCLNQLQPITCVSPIYHVYPTSKWVKSPNYEPLIQYYGCLLNKHFLRQLSRGFALVFTTHKTPCHNSRHTVINDPERRTCGRKGIQLNVWSLWPREVSCSSSMCYSSFEGNAILDWYTKVVYTCNGATMLPITQRFLNFLVLGWALELGMYGSCPDTLLSLFIKIDVAIIADDCNVPSSNNPYANLWLGLGNLVNKIWFVTAKKQFPQVIGHPSPVIFCVIPGSNCCDFGTAPKEGRLHVIRPRNWRVHGASCWVP